MRNTNWYGCTGHKYGD